MFKKEKIKGFVSGFLITILINIMTVNTFASPFSKSIEVLYNNIKLVVDGQSVQFGKDTAGNQIEPFIYNGTTYLPVRAVGEAVGKSVEWDGQTQTIYIGKKLIFEDEVVFIGNGIEDMNFQKDRWNAKYTNEYNSQFPIEDNIGNKYSNYFLIGIDAYGISNGTWAYVEFPLNGQYKEFKTTVGIPKTSKDVARPRNIKIFADDRLIYENIIESGFMPEDINLNISGALKLKVQVSVSDAMQYADTGFFNPRLTK